MRAVLFAAIGASLIGCNKSAPPAPISPAPRPRPQPTTETKNVELAKNVFLEVLPDGRRRVHVPAVVCFREGLLEVFMCRKQTKEHESIVTADIDARNLHQALLAAGAVAGSPAKFEPKYEPATGSIVRVFVQYPDGTVLKTVNARDWVRDLRTKKEMDLDWVFAGSFFFDSGEGENKRRLYAANSGEIVCLSNFGGAMMDLPIASSADNEELMFEAFTERIPPLGTAVTVIFEPATQSKPG